MSRLTSISRAQLLELMDEALEIAPRAARVCGFWLPDAADEPKDPRLKPSIPVELEEEKTGHGIDQGFKTTGLSTSPAPRPAVQFLFANQLDLLDTPPPVLPDTSLPILSNHELRVCHDQPLLPLPPLARWSRLAPFLRRALGQVMPGLRIDSRALERRIARGVPLTTLPRLPRTTWAPHAVVLRDHA